MPFLVLKIGDRAQRTGNNTTISDDLNINLHTFLEKIVSVANIRHSKNQIAIKHIIFYHSIMVDISEQINYWRNGALEDLDAAKQLIVVGKIRHGLFFAHLTLEKILKACVCKSTCKIAPKLHNLIRLVEMAGLQTSADRLDFLADMNDFNLEGRYPVQFLPKVSDDEVKEYMNKTQEMVQWCINQL